MAMKIKFENDTDRNLQICIEPFAETIEWGNGDLEIELKLMTDKYDDELSIAFSENALVLHECRQYEMRVYIEKELKYHTPSDRYLW